MILPLLLVEDNPQDEKLILRALGKANVANQIIVRRDGQQALDYLFVDDARGDDPWPPALILLDINLPRVNGLDILARIRQDARTALIPVVVLTSSDEDRDKLKSYRSGANSYVCKPLDFGEFAQTVGQLGIYWMAINRIPPRS